MRLPSDSLDPSLALTLVWGDGTGYWAPLGLSRSSARRAAGAQTDPAVTQHGGQTCSVLDTDRLLLFPWNKIEDNLFCFLDGQQEETKALPEG